MLQFDGDSDILRLDTSSLKTKSKGQGIFCNCRSARDTEKPLDPCPSSPFRRSSQRTVSGFAMLIGEALGGVEMLHSKFKKKFQLFMDNSSHRLHSKAVALPKAPMAVTFESVLVCHRISTPPPPPPPSPPRGGPVTRLIQPQFPLQTSKLIVMTSMECQVPDQKHPCKIGFSHCVSQVCLRSCMTKACTYVPVFCCCMRQHAKSITLSEAQCQSTSHQYLMMRTGSAQGERAPED